MFWKSRNLKIWIPIILVGVVIVIASVVLSQGEPIDLDTVKHSVELDQIIFDDFDNPFNRALPLTQATRQDIDRLRDRIAPFCHGEIDACLPINYETVGDASEWLSGGSRIIGYVAQDGQAYAYPFKILNYHEIVNETLADEPLLITYCPLCNSAVVYSRIIDDNEYIFGNTSALYQSDMVMYDIQTGSYWFQVEGRAILGELTDTLLTPVASSITTFREWREEFPDTLVLAQPSQRVNYSEDVFASYESVLNSGRFAFPITDEVANDNRLTAGMPVIIVEVGEEATAYPLRTLGDTATHDEIASESIVVLTRQAGPSANAFFTTLPDGTSVNLIYDEENENWRDMNTDSHFSFTGQGLSGELEGQQLEQIPSRYSFWFAAVAINPEISVYKVE